ncbi:hypothetical protein ACOQFO_12865 [Ureibacillus sp. MALMAid1270]|uniref:hypothetical protein n=1 Tax=Ureibacillus sp. MALMAid1270 TaxID=3411629 RepID=UPI003BA6682E
MRIELIFKSFRSCNTLLYLYGVNCFFNVLNPYVEHSPSLNFHDEMEKQLLIGVELEKYHARHLMVAFKDVQVLILKYIY